MRPYIKDLSQKLRRESTKEENHLWYDFLRKYPVRFRRQVPFERYIVDFYCAQAKLAVELDGSQHYKDDGPEYDYLRTEYLNQAYKIHVIRFTNLEVNKNFEGVCAAIHAEVCRRSPSSAPFGGTFPPVGGRL